MEPSSHSRDWLDQVQTGRIPPELAERWRRELRGSAPEAERLEEELALNAALDSLPAAPVPSNFVARVMAEIERDESRARRPAARWWAALAKLRFLAPASAAALLALALAGWWQARLHHRQSLAASVSEVAAVPGVEWLKDYDAIEAIPLLRTPAQPGDVELIAALWTP